MIEVEAPDGTIVEFPAGTPRDVMRGAMQRRFGGQMQVPAVDTWQPDIEVTTTAPRIGQQDATGEMDPPPRTMAQDAARGVGLGARSVMRQIGLGTRATAQGLGAFPGIAYDAAGAGVNMLAAIPNYFGANIPPVRSSRENIGAIADAAGMPAPATREERMMGAGIEGAAAVIPSMGAGLALQGARMAPRLAQMLLGPMSTQIAAGAGGGLAQQSAAEGGAGPLGQLGASLAGGLTGAAGMEAARGGGRLASAMLEPMRESGRERIVAEALLGSTNSPETLASRLQQGLPNTGQRLPESVPTLGTVTRDPALLRVESSVRAGALGPLAQANMGDADFARNAVRTQAIEGMGSNAAPEARGAAMRRALEGAESGQGARVDQLFNIARDRNTSRYSVQPVMDEAQRATRMFDPAQGGGGVPADLQSILDDIAGLRAVDISQAQNIRSRLGEVAGEAAAAGKTRLALAAGRISTSLENTIDDPRWMQAVETRRTMGGDLGRDATGTNAVGNIMRNDRFGAPMTPDQNVPRQILDNPDAVRQAVRASLRGIDDARTARNPNVDPDQLLAQHREMMGALRGQFAENLMRASRTTTDFANSGGNVQRGLNISRFNSFMDSNNRIAQELFEPHQYQQLSRIARDFSEGSMAANTGASRNSQTAQNMSVANLLARVSNGMLSSDNPTARQFGSLGGLIKVLYASPEAATRDMLTRAMTDPAFAQDILAKATPEAMQRVTARLGDLTQVGGALERSRVSGAEMLRRAAEGAALRQTTRSAGALEPSQERQ